MGAKQYKTIATVKQGCHSNIFFSFTEKICKHFTDSQTLIMAGVKLLGLNLALAWSLPEGLHLYFVTSVIIDIFTSLQIISK